MKFSLVVGALLVCGCSFVRADDASAPVDKSSYNLFRPTPSDLLRPMKMQVYDNVTDPTTVDAGHLQVEGGLINFFSSENRFSSPFFHQDISVSTYSWTPRFTAGLLNNLDLEVMPTYSISSLHSEAVLFNGTRFDDTIHSSGFGSVLVESKLNLWGNDSGMTALSVAPLVWVPTDGGDVNGGLNAAFALRLPRGFYAKVESQITIAPFHGGTFADFTEGLSINKSVCRRLDVYTTLTASVSTLSGSEWIGSAGFGAIFEVTRDFQLFGGLNFGLSDNSFEYNPRFGVAWRR